MTVFATTSAVPPCDAVVVPVIDGNVAGAEEVEAALGTELGPALRDLAAAGDHRDDPDASVVPTLGRAGYRAVVLVELARHRPGPPGLREAAMVAARACRPFRHVATTLTRAHAADAAAVEAVAEGWALGGYTFDRYRRESHEPATDRVTLVDPRLRRIDEPVEAAMVVAATTNLVRDLVNTPPGDASPLDVAEAVTDAAAPLGITTRLVEGAALVDEGFAGIVAVGAGSHRRPCLLEIGWLGDDAPGSGPPVVLAGKGITFDAGGLDLKPLSAMVTMKQDMAGAAAAAGAVIAAARLELPLSVTAFLALAENMPGGGALKPGDVVRHRNGVTTEIVSPDAEGRVVLADVLVAASEPRPRALVDVATLTGGGGLGPDIWAVFGTDPALLEALRGAGARVGDDGWPLPLWPPYRRYLRSAVADIRNSPSASRYGMAAIQGATFLEAFVAAGVPWAHLDTSAVASRTEQDATAAWGVGATGSPVRALIDWLRAEARSTSGADEP